MIVCVLISNDDYYDGGKGLSVRDAAFFLAARLHPHERERVKEKIVSVIKLYFKISFRVFIIKFQRGAVYEKKTRRPLLPVSHTHTQPESGTSGSKIN